MAKNKTKNAAAVAVPASTDTQVTTAATTEAAAVAPAKADADVKYDHVVVVRFYDKNDEGLPADKRRYYEKDSTVNQFGEERLNDLISRKLVEKRAK